MSTSPLRLEVDGVHKVFNAGRPNEFHALRGVSLLLELEGMTLIKGPSGSGKTTLLGIVGCMRRPTSGRVHVDGEEVTSLPEKFLTEVRRRTFGFVFQHFNLLRGLSVMENVMLPAYPLGVPRAELRENVLGILERLSIADKAHERVEWLSGGQAQRVAIARAMVNDPRVIVADEPTAHLDSKLSEEFVRIIGELSQRGRAVLIASHDPLVMESGLLGRTVEMRDGLVVDDGGAGR